LLPFLSLGGTLVLAGAAINGGVALPALPPLPGLPPLPTICDLPQEQVDQLAGAGSVDAQNCPDPEN
ncbi:hypothetical protein G6026_14145, partial [Dietzia sp. DQ11-38-2]|nr:hypothetical protein [Dietzia sp. DQ11-38-2]